MNETLRKIQAELKAPKNKWNDYGKYHYRSLESILEGVKPLLEKYGAELVITDSIVYMEGRWYIKAVAVFESEEGEVVGVGWARESEAKKGMDESQITGTASSYARKYALNGLFLIDDTKDSDTDENRRESDTRAAEQEAQDNPKVSEEQIKKLVKYAESLGVSVDAILSRYGIKDLHELTLEDYAGALRSLSKNEEAEKNRRKAK